MNSHFVYQAVRGGMVKLVTSELELQLLGVSSSAPGRYEVKATGQLPQDNELLLLPVKGAKTIALKLKVVEVEPLIQPQNAWKALCIGPEFRAFQLRQANIICDSCNKAVNLEFIEYSDDTQADAIEGMKQAGWQASSDTQICPDCIRPSKHHGDSADE